MMENQNTGKSYEIVKVPIDEEHQRKFFEKIGVEPIKRLSPEELDAAKNRIEDENAKILEQDFHRKKRKQKNFANADMFSQAVTPMIIKALISGGAYWMLNRNSFSNWGFQTSLYAFLMYYFICSIYQFSLKITRNYLLAIILTVAIPFIAMAIGLDDLQNKIFVGRIGQEIMVALFLFLPPGLDIYRIIRAGKR